MTVDLVKSATFKSGGCYMFSNLRGCDGSRLYFNGGSSITLNGQILNRGKQFALDDVEVIVATFDLENIRFATDRSRAMIRYTRGEKLCVDGSV